MATGTTFARSPAARVEPVRLERTSHTNRSKMTPPTTTPTAPLVEVLHLRKSYGDHLAVKDVSFRLESGEVLGLLGPNGAGKSTTMMMIAGLLPPTSGEIQFSGQKFDGRNFEHRRMLGVVPQEYAIYQDLNAIDNLSFFGKLYGLRGQKLKDRCDEVLNEIGLTESAKRLSGTYSGGMKRRLNFGVALIHRPRILILDEPTVGVDPQSRAHLMDCIREQAANGVGVIYASHYMEEVQSICQRVAIVDHGEVLANDSIPKLLSGLAADIHLYVDRTTGIANLLDDWTHISTGADGEPIVVVTGDAKNGKPANEHETLHYGLKSPSKGANGAPPDMAWRLQAALYRLGTLGIRVLRVETQQSNLERLFLNLTGNRLRD